MFELINFVRPNIRNLKPYSSARDEYQGRGGVFLDANENPYGKLNRYPDPYHTLLRRTLGELKGVDPSKIFIGNGSDEIIDLSFRIFCEPGKDRAISFNPTYGMYSVAAAMNDVDLVTLDLNEDFDIDNESLMPLMNDESIKILIVCSPNNPTGNLIRNIGSVLENFKGIILADEAYIDFSGHESLMRSLDRFPNLIVMQTLSKAYGLAGARIGIAYASRDIVDLFYRVKPPYNVSTPNQKAALDSLSVSPLTMRRAEEIVSEREVLKRELLMIPAVKKIWPSDANFLLVKVDDPDLVYDRLIRQKVIVRNRNSQVPGALRITVGTPSENRRLLGALAGFSGATAGECKEDLNVSSSTGAGRTSDVTRITSETSVVVRLSLDGEGLSSIDTGIGFLDHMLTQLARHGGIDLDVSASGDIEVDEHHTVEDVALALGEAFDRSLGLRRGIERFGFLLPMDDALAQVALDFGGRPCLVWDVKFSTERTGGIGNDMFRHFFSSFCDSARCNLNIKAEGYNDHHKIEAIFKAFARSVKMAVSQTGSNRIPSTKGVI
jgi:histidinol-phosphate aminotransferase